MKIGEKYEVLRDFREEHVHVVKGEIIEFRRTEISLNPQDAPKLVFVTTDGYLVRFAVSVCKHYVKKIGGA